MRASASRFLAAGLLAAAGCTGGGDGDYPILPGGGADPGTHEPAPVLRGRVCLATDLRDFSTCAPSGAGDLAVSAGGASAITGDDGGFELRRPEGGGGDLMVTGPGVFPTITPYASSAGTVLVTAIDADVYARELATNGVLLPDDTGSILGRVIAGEGPATGIGVVSMPAAPFGPFYDGTDAFTLDRTGARGVFFVPGLTAGAATLTFRDLATAGETIVNGVMVRNGGITILDSVTLP
jgi:hypothetical protein